jgi:ABC-type phosphate transport system auxiliary subunit
MPITAKLSREFYERFGDKVVNEMVDLFNRIEDAARSDLRLLNEQNALRFEARLSQQTAELGARIQTVEAKVDGVERRLDGLEKRIDSLDGKLAALRDELHRALLIQTRWMIGAWGILIASQIALWFR